MTERLLVQRELFASPEDMERACGIVQEELGEGFHLEYGTLPKNVGVRGDVGVRGETLVIVSDLADPCKFLAENYERIAEISNRLCNETSSATRVLFEITPG